MTGASDFPMHHISPFQTYHFCRLVLPFKWLGYSLLFLTLVYFHSYLLALVYYHIFFFFFSQCFLWSFCFVLPSEPLSVHRDTTTTTKMLDGLWSSFFMKVNFNIQHICILNPQTENLWVNSRHVWITMYFCWLFLRCTCFTMLKVFTKILLELLT